MKHKYIKHLEQCLAATDKYESKLNASNGAEILSMEGMTGKKTRHFYNNLCSMEEARYLEIGVWKGSSFCSAMYNNSMTCLCIDNWTEFGGAPPGKPKGWLKEAFLHNYTKAKGKNNSTYIERNCWDVDVSALGKFNIYLFDGGHDETSHYKALSHYLPCLDNEFIFLIDDWNCKNKIQAGTLKSIKDHNLEIIYRNDIYSDTNPGIQQGALQNDWHNGLGIFVLKKPSP